MFKLFGFGDSHEKIIKKLNPTVDRINQLEPAYQSLTNDELKAKTREFKQRLVEGETSTACYRRLLLPCERPQSGPWGSDITTYS
jgi:preprotein translocase subunit SecA